MRISRWTCFSILACFLAVILAQQSAPSAVVAQPQSSSIATASMPTRITLDVVVNDKAGKSVAELEPPDFTLLDNNQPRKILSFRRTDGLVGSKFDPPVEVVIVLDSVNMPYQAVTLLRLQLEKFLRQNGGRLAQPVSILAYGSDGLRVLPLPTKDGNALAAMMNTSVGTVRARGTAAGSYGLAEQFTASVQTLKGIADNYARRPGRKMIVWLGNGWPLLDGPQFTLSTEVRQRHYEDILEVSKKLREARIVLYGLYTLNAADDRLLYEAYLKPVKDFRRAEAGNVSLQVLAMQTGGRVLEPSNDIAGQINSCVADIGAYYTLTFAPPPAMQTNEYHDLKVQVTQPGLTTRTSSGYYDQP